MSVVTSAADVFVDAGTSRQREPADFSGIDRTGPNFVDVRRATGGFSSAVEVSNSCCLRFYAAHVGPVEVIARHRGRGLETVLEPLRSTLSDPWWQSFQPAPEEPYGFGYRLEPRVLRIDSGDELTIAFDGSLSLYGVRASRPPLPPHGTSSAIFDRADEVLAREEGNRLLGDAPELRSAGSLDPDDIKPFRGGAGHADWALWLAPLVPIRQIGQVQVILRGRLSSEEHAAQRSVDIYIDLTKAAVDVEVADGDADLIYEAFLAGRATELKAVVAPEVRLRITPTISIVGRNAANTAVPEFPDFDVQVFPVGDPDGLQAVCAAFDLVPGCVGTIEDVRHFIGRADYGVIHSEFVVERVLHHQWNVGGFDRSLNLVRRTSIKVRRDGSDRDEDADVYGRMRLNILEAVALEPHPDLRSDVILVGGRGDVIADRVVLVRDGTVLTPSNADIGPPEPVPWAVNLDPSLSPVWSSDYEIRQFQERASQDGVRHLSRPFARVPDAGGALTDYVRLEAIAKRFFARGQLQGFF
jgi:hypothetical protein